MSEYRLWLGRKIGSTVRLSEDVTGMVTNITLSEGCVTYQVAWWVGSQRYQAWLEACEIEDVEVEDIESEEATDEQSLDQ